MLAVTAAAVRMIERMERCQIAILCYAVNTTRSYSCGQKGVRAKSIQAQRERARDIPEELAIPKLYHDDSGDRSGQTHTREKINQTYGNGSG
jgi:hypothetical protein